MATPASVLVSTTGMDRKTWLEMRRRGIGGSDAAAIVGLNPYKSAYGVYLEKRGEIEPQEAGEAAYWGHRLEDALAHEFASRHPEYRVRRRNAILRHREHPFMLANVDRLLNAARPGIEPAVLEIKTTSSYNADEWLDGAPDYYLIQLQHYLAVTGRSVGWFAVLIGGQTYIEREVRRDDEVIRYLIEAEAEFWRHVEEGTPPDPDGSKECARLLAQKYPGGDKEILQFPAEAETWIRRYREAHQIIVRSQAIKEEAANRIKAILGNHEKGIVNGETVTWKPSFTKEFDKERFRAEHPDLYEAYTVMRPSRTFRVANL